MFKLEGSVDRYLFVKPGWLNWSIRSSLDAEERFIESGSSGESCPAHPVPNTQSSEKENTDSSLQICIENQTEYRAMIVLRFVLPGDRQLTNVPLPLLGAHR